MIIELVSLSTIYHISSIMMYASMGFYFRQIEMKNKRNSFKQSISWTWVMIWLLILMILYYFINISIHDKNTTSKVCIEKKCFTVEIARTSAEQQQGLMNREAMESNQGMIFIFPQADIHNFWMKNTLIPLDMIRVDDTFKVVRVLTAQPCTQDPCKVYKPEALAKYVIEINAWIAAKYGIGEWSVVKFRNIE